MKSYQIITNGTIILWILTLCLSVEQIFSKVCVRDSQTRVCETKMDFEKAHELKNQINKSGFANGNPNILVLGIQFPDIPAESDIVSVDSLMNIHSLDDEGKGSFKDYFREVSYGKFIPESHVYGWYTADNNYEYYENEIGLSAARDSLFIEALSKANADGVDFSPFDNNGDGEAEAVILLTSRAVGAQARF